MSFEYLEDFEEPLIPGMVRAQPIIHRYIMPNEVETAIRNIGYQFGYGAFSQTVYYRTYSQLKPDGTKEDFPDTVIRVINGIISIAKDWKVKHALEWDENHWNDIAFRFGKSMMNMQLLPPGRGLWISGTEFSYKRGSVAFNNCGFCSLNEGIVKAACWTMDSLMCGCGIGFDTDVTNEFDNLVIPGCEQCENNRDYKFFEAFTCNCKKRAYKIHDSREGWVKSVYLLLNSYFDGTMTVFDYSDLRSEGVPIKGFGGVSSGADPLIILHERIRLFMRCFVEAKEMGAYEAILKMTRDHASIYPYGNKVEVPSLLYAYNQLIEMSPEMRSQKTYGTSRLVCDIFNAIGICIVAGNVRRSSEVSLGFASDNEFKNLKNHDLNPERGIISWMSNNSVCLDKTEDFELLPEIAERIKDNGEPGIFNRINGKRYGRIGKREPIGREAEEDRAIGLNPCCISGDSLITTTEGLIKASDLAGKQFKAVIDGKIYESTECGFWSTGIKSVYEITLENGMKIKATKDHRFHIGRYNHYDLSWIRLEEIRSIDNNYFDIDSGVPSKLISIKSMGDEEVFDCTIPGPNCFIANGIVTHNCEIQLESFEYCNLAELFPTRCNTMEELEEAAYLATLYTSTVALLPTHWVYSNTVISRNRRIGVSISGITEEIARSSVTMFTKKCRSLYRLVRNVNKKLAEENGVPASIRVTTVKPSGTISQLVGVSSGVHHNTYKYCIRRIRISNGSKLAESLKNAGYDWEIDRKAGEGTLVFSFPLHQGNARTAEEVSMWEQASNLALLQREWADNSVSCTIYFNPETEASDLEHLLAQYVPITKCISALPHTSEGVYDQAPYEKISKEEYDLMTAKVRKIKLNSDGDEAIGTRGCDGDTCELKNYKLASKY